MVTELEFYKDEGKWYADVEDHTKEDNEMVLGADELLESFHKDRIKLALGDEYVSEYDLILSMVEHDDDGATYVVACSTTFDILEGTSLWICNVTHDVLGEHPNHIFIKIID